MIAVLNFGMGNIHSILKALSLYYPDVIFTNEKEKIKKAKAIVLPGDGHFHTAMLNLRGELEDLILEHNYQQKPILGICIGFQILFEDSNEVLKETGIEQISGFGFLKGKIRKFIPANTTIKIPHMGWNRLIPDSRLKDISEYFKHYMYFIHSYRAIEVPDEFVITYTYYNEEFFPSTVRKDNVIAVQYHPEKSDRAGLHFLKDWINHL